MKNHLQGFREQINGLNEVLHKKYDSILSMDKEDLKKKLLSLGRLEKMEILSEEELKTLAPLVGVDGSTVRLGGAHPHYVEIFQGLAKSTQGQDIFMQRLYTPLISTDTEEEGSKLHNKLLAEVEIDCAIASIEEIRPKVIIMDGGLLRYKINCEDKWKILQEMSIAEEVLICGAIKDIKTYMISESLGYGLNFYDREVLAGKLDRGEIFIVNEEENTKNSKGFSSAFYRPSKHNEVVGIDVLNEQKQYIEFLCRVLYTLTPSESRGVPFWIDIVDKECKLTPETLRVLLEENLDRDLMERFFISERDRRS